MKVKYYTSVVGDTGRFIWIESKTIDQEILPILEDSVQISNLVFRVVDRIWCFDEETKEAFIKIYLG